MGLLTDTSLVQSTVGSGDKGLKPAADTELSSGVHGGIGRLIVVSDPGLNTRGELHTRQKRLRIVVPVEPLFRLQNTNRVSLSPTT